MGRPARKASGKSPGKPRPPERAPGEPKPVNKRSTARLHAVQALYQMDVGGTGILETVAEYENYRLGGVIDGEQYRDADPQWFRRIVAGVVEHQRTLDPQIRDCLLEGWPLSRLDTTLRAILRAGAFELAHIPDVPVAVVVSEYVDIAKAFYAEDEPKLVNAVLDRLALRLKRK